MNKTLNQMLKSHKTGYYPKPGDEQKFVEKHVGVKVKHLGGKATEDDQVFQATNIKTGKREYEHGYDADKSDQQVYEEKKKPSMLRKMKRKAIGAMLGKEYKWMMEQSNANQELQGVAEGIEDRLEAAREKAKATGKNIKDKKPEEKKVRMIQGKAYGGSKQKEDQEDMNESKTSDALYKQHHARVKDLLKKISSAADTHKANVLAGNSHYGHVGDMNSFANQLQDIHDRIAMHGEYAAPVMKEDVVIESSAKARISRMMQDKEMVKNPPKIPTPAERRAKEQEEKKPVKENAVSVEEKKLTSAEMKKREEVAKAIERENPKMPMSKKMAIATATAKKVAEQKTFQQFMREAMEDNSVTLHVKPHPNKRGHHVIVKSSDESRFEKGESVSGEELEQGQDDGYLKVKHVKG